MQPVIIELPLPHDSLHPNARVHWREKAKHTKIARELAALVARSIYTGKPFKQACYRLVFWLPRKRDYDGLNAWLKAYLDGLQGIVVVNDSDLRPMGIERFSGKECDGKRGVRITIWEEAESYFVRD